MTQLILGIICIPLAYMAAYSFCKIIDYRQQSRRYVPPQRLVTSRFKEMVKAQSRYERLFAAGIDGCKWLRVEIEDGEVSLLLAA